MESQMNKLEDKTKEGKILAQKNKSADVSDTGVIDNNQSMVGDNLEDSFQRLYSRELDLDEDEVAIILHELNDSAIHFISREQYERALQLLQKAQTLLDRLQFQRNPNDRFVILVTMHNMALCFQKLSALEECALCLEACLQQLNSPFLLPKLTGDPSKKLKKLKYECKVHMQICALLSQLHRHQEALIHAKKSVQITQYLINDLQQMVEFYHYKVCQAKKTENLAQEIMNGDKQQLNKDENNNPFTKDVIFYDDSVSMLERTSFKLFPIIQEVVTRLVKEKDVALHLQKPNQNQTQKQPMIKQLPNMKALLGYLNQSEWLFLLNIGNIMQIAPLTVSDMYSTTSWEVELTRESILEKISFLSVSYFCMSTELRFIYQIKDDPTINVAQKKRESEYWHSKALEIACSFFPSESPLVSHILSSYQKHHAPVQQAIPEEEEATQHLKVIRPIAGIDHCKFQPMVRSDNELSIILTPLNLSPNHYIEENQKKQMKNGGMMGGGKQFGNKMLSNGGKESQSVSTTPFSPINQNLVLSQIQTSQHTQKLLTETTSSQNLRNESSMTNQNQQQRYKGGVGGVTAGQQHQQFKKSKEIANKMGKGTMENNDSILEGGEESILGSDSNQNNKSMMAVPPSQNFNKLFNELAQGQNQSQIIGGQDNQLFDLEEGNQIESQDIASELQNMLQKKKNRRRRHHKSYSQVIEQEDHQQQYEIDDDEDEDVDDEQEIEEEVDDQFIEDYADELDDIIEEKFDSQVRLDTNENFKGGEGKKSELLKENVQKSDEKKGKLKRPQTSQGLRKSQNRLNQNEDHMQGEKNRGDQQQMKQQQQIHQLRQKQELLIKKNNLFALERDKSDQLLPSAHSVIQTSGLQGGLHILSEGISPNSRVAINRHNQSMGSNKIKSKFSHTGMGKVNNENNNHNSVSNQILSGGAQSLQSKEGKGISPNRNQFGQNSSNNNKIKQNKGNQFIREDDRQDISKINLSTFSEMGRKSASKSKRSRIPENQSSSLGRRNTQETILTQQYINKSQAAFVGGASKKGTLNSAGKSKKSNQKKNVHVDGIFNDILQVDLGSGHQQIQLRRDTGGGHSAAVGGVTQQPSKSFEIGDMQFGTQYVQGARQKSRVKGSSQNRSKEKLKQQQQMKTATTFTVENINGQNIEEIKRQILLKQALLDGGSNAKTQNQRRKSTGIVSTNANTGQSSAQMNTAGNKRRTDQNNIVTMNRSVTPGLQQSSQLSTQQSQQQFMVLQQQQQQVSSGKQLFQQNNSMSNQQFQMPQLQKFNTHSLIKKFLQERQTNQSYSSTAANTNGSLAQASKQQFLQDNYSTAANPSSKQVNNKIEKLQKKLIQQQQRLMNQDNYRAQYSTEVHPSNQRQQSSSNNNAPLIDANDLLKILKVSQKNNSIKQQQQLATHKQQEIKYNSQLNNNSLNHEFLNSGNGYNNNSILKEYNSNINDLKLGEDIVALKTAIKKKMKKTTPKNINNQFAMN